MDFCRKLLKVKKEFDRKSIEKDFGKNCIEIVLLASQSPDQQGYYHFIGGCLKQLFWRTFAPSSEICFPRQFSFAYTFLSFNFPGQYKLEHRILFHFHWYDRNNSVSFVLYKTVVPSPLTFRSIHIIFSIRRGVRVEKKTN